MTKKFLMMAGLSAAAVFLTAAPVMADDRDDHHAKRYYDKDHRDYHAYSNQEDRAFRIYLAEQHRDYREFRRENRAEQQRCFRWRHEHPDHMLFKVEIH